MKIWSLPKHENLTTGKNIVEKRRNCSLGAISPLFHNIFNISLTSRVQLHIYLLDVVVRTNFFAILQIWHVEIRIPRSISESPLEFEITRVDWNYNITLNAGYNVKALKVLWYFYIFSWWDMTQCMTKPTKWHVRPAKTRISQGICPVWPESLLFAWRKLGSLATDWAHSRDWSDLIWVFAGTHAILMAGIFFIWKPVISNY